jgi:chemotaxis protein MotB
MNAPVQPIIIVRKKKGGHAAHHGGAWKVAYADFVTAMMSLFMVLWLLNSSEQVKKAVGGYFTDPRGHGKDVGNGIKANGNGNLSLNAKDLSHLKDKLEEAVRQEQTLQKIKDNVVISVTNEGLRVELIEGSGSTFFESGSPAPTDTGKDMLAKLATEIGKLPNKVTIEGHTDSTPFNGRPGYSNWELSTDRANAARRLMQSLGMREDQVTQVRGYADQSPRDAANPEDPSNRRVTMIILNQAPSPNVDAAGNLSADKAAGAAQPTPPGKPAGKPEAPSPAATAAAKPSPIPLPQAQTPKKTK